MTNTATDYYLSPHTFLCLTDHQYVFLDLHNDKYSCFDPEKSELLRQLLDKEYTDSPKISLRSTSGAGATSQLVDELFERGLLTQDREKGKTVAPVTLCPPAHDLRGVDPDLKPTIRLPDVVNFFSAAIKSAIRLRCLSLEQVTRRVKRKKQKHKKNSNTLSSSTSTTNLSSNERLQKLLQIFYLLRPLAYTAQNQCLYDALVLLEFLSRYDIYPDWVFGVAMGPFSAHCWVQKGETVFNDSVAHTAFHTPIMVV